MKVQKLMPTTGIEFVEFASQHPEQLQRQFELLGFTLVGEHRNKEVLLYRQNEIHFVLNCEPQSSASTFADVHGDSVNAIAFRVDDSAVATKIARERGATVVEPKVGPMELAIPAVLGVGGSLIYLIDRYGEQTIYDVDFKLSSRYWDRDEGSLTHVDHLTHNLERGNVEKYSDFYTRVFDFHEVQSFTIHGAHTGLISKVMSNETSTIRIPMNESSDRQSQIEEFLQRYRGEGVQHIALHTSDIFSTVNSLRENGVHFQSTPDSYYEQLDERIQDHGQDLATLKDLQILLDGSTQEGFLLQIFTQDMVGPIFFEIIQRLGNKGFGEGNFQALFESVERDQIQRGVLSEAN